MAAQEYYVGDVSLSESYDHAIEFLKQVRNQGKQNQFFVLVLQADEVDDGVMITEVQFIHNQYDTMNALANLETMARNMQKVEIAQSHNIGLKN